MIINQIIPKKKSLEEFIEFDNIKKKLGIYSWALYNTPNISNLLFIKNQIIYSISCGGFIYDNTEKILKFNNSYDMACMNKILSNYLECKKLIFGENQ